MTIEYILYIGIVISAIAGLAGEYQMHKKRRPKKAGKITGPAER